MNQTHKGEQILERFPHRCWLLVHRETERVWENGDFAPHFKSEREASSRAADLLDPWSYVPTQQYFHCLEGPTCFNCGGTFEDWNDGGSHCTPGKAAQEIEDCDWKWSSRGWACGDCAHWIDDSAA